MRSASGRPDPVSPKLPKEIHPGFQDIPRGETGPVNAA